ncbi:MAG TPA: ABC transporter substrate-binding protein, partial [Ilumatobacteraceae bacterium]
MLAACGDDDDDGGDGNTEQPETSEDGAVTSEAVTTDGSTDGSTSGSAPTEGAAPEGELVVDVETLNSENFIVSLGHEAETSYTSLVYETLLYAKHDTLELMPGLATEWTTSDDGLSWTFTLREGVMFHDKDGNEAGELTSADVKATIETAMGTNSTWYALTTWQAVLDSIDTPDPYTVVINLTAPYPGLPGDVSSLAGGLQILSAEHLADVGVEGALTDPVGTGPYVLESQSRGASMTLRALPEHWRVVPEFETIRFDIVPEETTRLANVRSGAADIAQLSGVSLASAGDVDIQETPDAWTSHVTLGGLYFDRPEYVDVPYADASVRHAFSMAIDREALAETLYGGAAEPGTGWGLYTFSSELTPPPYDPDEARRLLEEA